MSGAPPPVVIRPIRRSDAVRLSHAMARLSAESARRRFLTAKRALSPAELRYLTAVDGIDHVALVAVLRSDPERIVAVGRFVRLADDPEAAEMAIVVGDEFQGRGLGRRLTRLLADAAQACGIRRFTASMLSENDAAVRLFAGVSTSLRVQDSHGVRELVAELEPPALAAA